MFVFPLQKVLEYRKKVEEEEQRRLAAAYQETDAARAELGALRDVLSTLQESYSSCQENSINIPQVMQACAYAALLTARVKDGEDALQRLEEQLNTQVRLTEKAMQERKVMDTLRDKGLARYRHEVNTAEQRETDEMARTVFLRSNPQ